MDIAKIYNKNKELLENGKSNEYTEILSHEFNVEFCKKLFLELMDLYEFEVYEVINDEGETKLKLRDLQGANLGNIESEEFNDFYEILDRMDAYHNDYIIEDLEKAIDYELPNVEDEWSSWEQLYNITINNYEKLAEYDWDIRALYLILHSDTLKGVGF